jgi:hypothetical protein
MGKSLEEVNESVSTLNKKSVFENTSLFLVRLPYQCWIYGSGNWATDIAGGSQFGYSLLWFYWWVISWLLLLQSLSARLGIVDSTGSGTSPRETYSPFINYILYSLLGCHRGLWSSWGFRNGYWYNFTVWYPTYRRGNDYGFTFIVVWSIKASVNGGFYHYFLLYWGSFIFEMILRKLKWTKWF